MLFGVLLNQVVKQGALRAIALDGSEKKSTATERASSSRCASTARARIWALHSILISGLAKPIWTAISPLIRRIRSMICSN